MTIASPASSASFAGNGVTLSFPLPFRFVSTADVAVVLRDADGSETLLTETTDYALSGAGEAPGGACALASPPLPGQTLVCTRAPRILQETDYQENDAFPAESHEAALDLLTMICQALDEKIARAPLVKVSAAARGLSLGDPAPGRALVWGADGLTLEPGPEAGDIAQAQGYAAQAAQSAIQAETARDASQAARDQAQASAASLDPATIARKADLAALDELRTLLLAEALRRAIGDSVDGREFLGNGWIDPLADAGEVLVTNGSFVSADGGYITNAGADDAVTALDLTAAQFLDEKGSIATFTVDTDKRSGHFNAPVNSRVIAGCRMVINGASHPITQISGDGTAADSVVFTGSLAAGAHAVTGVFGPEVSGSAVELPAAWHPNIPVMTGNGPQAGVTVSASSSTSGYDAYKAFDNVGNSTSAWLSTTAAASWLKMDLGAAKTIHRYAITCPPTAALARAPKTWTLQGSATGAFSGEQATVDSRSNVTDWTNLETRTFDLAAPATHRHFRLYITANNGDATYHQIVEMQVYTRVIPAGVAYPLSLAVDCADWTALKSIAPTETLNSQNIWYALSFDNGTTYSAFVSGAWLAIVRNSAGTWEYWTGSAWAASGINSALGAMAQAAGVAGDRMTGAALAGLSQAQIEGSGGFAPGQASLPVLAALYSGSTTATPVLSGVTLTADIQAHDASFEFDAFEASDPDLAKVVFVMEAVDDVTLDADLAAWVRRGEGDYTQVPLAVDSAFDASRVLAAGDLDQAAGSGAATRLKLTCHNHKELRVHAAANCFRSA